MPIEPEHAAERLEPERIGQPAQRLGRSVLGNDVREHFTGEENHPIEQPGGRFAAVQREVGEA